MNIEECEGYKKLMAAVVKDCDEHAKCFNPNGCEKHPCKCFHAYCDKFKWTLCRAQHYSEKTGIPASEILDTWERRRNYWYQNYYQDINQPLIGGDNVRLFDTEKDLVAAVQGKGFRCPSCGKISKNHMECDAGDCDWKAYGLFRTLGKGITVIVKEDLRMGEMFMPVAWEGKT